MWHVEQNGQAKGPFTDEQLKAMCESGAVNAGTLVWRQGWAGWKPLSESDFQFKASASAPAMLAPPPAIGAQLGPDYSGLPPAPTDLSMWQCFVRCITTRYTGFTGRARRKEYWSFTLFWTIFMFLVAAIGLGIDAAVGNLSGGEGQAMPIAFAVLMVLYILAMLLPSWAVLVRRLHDIGLSGWLVLISFIPYLGGLALFVMTLIPSEAADNKHGAKAPSV